MQEDVGDQRRRETCASANTREDQPVGDAALADRNPTRHQPVACGIDDGLSDSEKKSHSYQRGNCEPESARNRSRERGEHRPPDRANGKDAPWPKSVGEPPAGRLEQRVSPVECAHHRAELYKIETVFMC